MDEIDEINEEIVAAIEAAIFAAFGNSASKFRIKTIKRVSSGMPEWRKAGLYSQMK